ncbi:MAG: RIP metalloprotease RseP [SAR202 cluster bacterium Io17-Chloro-G2]|nr:MAG: RIP metalloprotease RseP [SAR202 cluster bacterium Io17-Chloro-G2]
MTTVLIAVGAMVPMLLFLVVIHEWGHFATARALGVKVLEFGVGFPPRAFAIYTGRTRVLLDPQTRYVGIDSSAALTAGQFVKVASSEDVHGNLVARIIEAPQPKGWFKGGKSQAGGDEIEEDTATGSDDYLRHEGKIRELDGGSLMLADLLYTVNWAPLGGFVRLAGESNPNIPRSLASKGVGTRFIVLVAGSFMNALLPLVIFTVLLMIPKDVTVGQVQVTDVTLGSPAGESGIQRGDILLVAKGDEIETNGDLTRVINLNGGSTMDWLILRGGRQEVVTLQPRYGLPRGHWRVGVSIGSEGGQVVVNQVLGESPAAAAGLQPNDVVLAAGDHRIAQQQDLIDAIAEVQDAELQLVISRDGREQRIPVTPRFEQSSDPQWLTGITTRMINPRTESRSKPIWSAAPQSFVSTWELLVLVKQGFSGAISEGQAPKVAGPVGIAKVAGEFTREGGFTGWLVITVLLSINLAIINILPIPMLDGGRVVFVVLEWVRRGRRVPAEKEGLVHLIGFVVLMAGVLLITANDIRELLS